MKSKHKIHLIASILLVLNLASYGQISNYIYALNNDSAGVFYFSKIEISTGIITNFQTVTTSNGSNNSACINNQAQVYYFCTGKLLETFDPISGNLISSVALPIPSTDAFIHIQYNPCDSNIYGIIKSSASVSFSRLNPVTGVMKTISALNPNTSFCYGCMSILDPDSGIFVFHNGALIGIDITSGQILFNTPVVNLPNELFGHIALKCSTHEIFGTSANPNSNVKYLSTFNPYTGIVTHVSASGWNVGIFKPAQGGDCINQFTGDYFYSGAGHLLVGANTVSGNVIFNQIINSGELNFIQHFSQCSCTLTGIEEANNSGPQIMLTPNPFFDKLNITANTNKMYEIILYDITSRKLLRQEFIRSVLIHTEQLAKGIYLYEVRNENKVVKKGKVVKD